GLSITLLSIPVIALRCFGVRLSERGRKGLGRRWLQFAWLAAWLFLIWKQGFVRVGRDHIELFIGFVPIALLGLRVLHFDSRFAKYTADGLVALVCLISVVMLVELFAGDLRAVVYRPCLLAAHNAKALFNPGTYLREIRALQEAERDAMQ